MQSIRLVVIVFFAAVILCGALLMIGCNGSSSGGDNISYNLDCTLNNVSGAGECKTLSAGNSCQNPFIYDPKSKTCNIYACLYCSQ